jgi:hypothetical protein
MGKRTTAEWCQFCPSLLDVGSLDSIVEGFDKVLRVEPRSGDAKTSVAQDHGIQISDPTSDYTDEISLPTMPVTEIAEKVDSLLIGPARGLAFVEVQGSAVETRLAVGRAEIDPGKHVGAGHTCQWAGSTGKTSTSFPITLDNGCHLAYNTFARGIALPGGGSAVRRDPGNLSQPPC